MSKITKIEYQKSNKERVNVYIDGKYAFPAYADIIINQGIKKGMEVDSQILQNINIEERKKKCKSDAIKIIEHSSKTVKEVKDKLRLKEYQDSEILYAVNFLQEYGFIDDRIYAKSFVHDKLIKNGRNKIRYELKRKGISDDIISEVLDAIDCDSEVQIAVKIGQKKYNQIIKRESDKYKIKNKLYTFLAGRGYSFDIVKKAIDVIIKDQ